MVQQLQTKTLQTYNQKQKQAKKNKIKKAD